MAKFVDIITRLPKGTPLTYVEMDANLTNLQRASAPIGTVFTYMSTADLPATWLECNGASLATATYDDLYSIIGNTYGGDATNFNLPDFRGQFLRGFDNGAGEDAGRVFSDPQLDEVKSHTHEVMYTHYHGDTGGSTRHIGNAEGRRGDVTSDPYGGAETRPKNYAVTYIIKASV